MRKLTTLMIACVAGVCSITASPVTQNTAQKVATNFFGQNSSTPISQVSLAYTETDPSGNPVFYVFNINTSDGFVIVSADDALHPIIGYSVEKRAYKIPVKGTNIYYWMQKRKTEIMYDVTNKVTADAVINDEWTSYLNNNIPTKARRATHRAMGSIFPSSSYLVQSTWDQPAPYNDDCPGSSVTGCVATAMSQIMRYWSYPAKGQGSSSYNEGTYGTLSANYDHPYRWTNMPLTSPNSGDTDMARLLSDAGISVQMSYSPSGSGAYVITADDPSACAQISYVTYFKYSSTILNGQYANSNATTWQDTIAHDLDCNRPVQYVGTDPSAGGHTWVCDGYDVSYNFHMNWGWSGADDGNYALNNLAPTGSGYNFSQGHEALTGIMPAGLEAAFRPNPNFGCVGSTTINFTDQSVGQFPITNWNWSFPGGSPPTSAVQNPTVTYSSAGIYNVTEVVTDSTGAKDTLTKLACITVDPTTGGALPLVQGFEGSWVPAGWVIHNPLGHSTTWSQTLSGYGGYGKSNFSMFYNNCSGGVAGTRDQIYSPMLNFGSVTTPKMYFDVAYEPEDDASNESSLGNVLYSDTLAIYYSTDCGSTWTNVYLKGGDNLATTGGTQYAGTDVGANGPYCFTPANNHWRTDTISIPAIAGISGVMFSFENRSGNGCTMYIDNINIPGVPLSVFNPLANSTGASIFPNPNNGSFTVELSNVQSKQMIEVFNVLGQSVYSSELNQNETQINLQQPTGIYFYHIMSVDGKMLSQGKLIIKE